MSHSCITMVQEMSLEHLGRVTVTIFVWQGARLRTHQRAKGKRRRCCDVLYCSNSFLDTLRSRVGLKTISMAV